MTPKEHILTTDEIIRVAAAFVDAGVDKIRLTGGEPLVRTDVDEVLRRLRTIDGLRTLSITTNGILVPRKLQTLVDVGLDQINISLDTLDAQKFFHITRRNGYHKVREAIGLAIQSPIPNVKVNCVVVRGVNDQELHNFVELTRDSRLDVRFIEYMPFDGNRWGEAKLVDYNEMLRTVKASYPDLEPLPIEPNHTAKQWRVPGFKGQIGFITSMSEHFCASCNRIRMTADGNFKSCLFAGTELNMLTLLRSGISDEELMQKVHGALGKKKARHAGMHTIALQNNRPMIKIGG